MNIRNNSRINRIPAVEPRQLSVWTAELLSEGRLSFTIDEAMQSLGVSRGAFLDAAERLQKQTRLVRPKIGFYLIVPPRYVNIGGPPPIWYIDDLMRFLDRPYYVALRTAADYQGATHHGVMHFQVMTNKMMPRIMVGRSIFVLLCNFSGL